MSVETELSRIKQAKDNIKTSIEGKGVEVSSDAKLDAYPALIDSIQAGTSYFTGHVDEAGLREIGWQDDDIEYLKSIIWWNAEMDYYYTVDDLSKKWYKEKTSYAKTDVQSGGDYYGAKFLPRFPNKSKEVKFFENTTINISPLFKNVHEDGYFAQLLSTTLDWVNLRNISVDDMYLTYTNMSGFAGLHRALVDLSIKNVTVPGDKVTMASLMANCPRLQRINIDIYANIYTLATAFAYDGELNSCSIITRNNISESIITDRMFQNNYGLEYIDLDFNNVPLYTCTQMFVGCHNLKKINGILNMSLVEDTTGFIEDNVEYAKLYGLKTSISFGLNPECIHYAIQNAIGGAEDAYITFTLSSIAKANWEASDYYAEDISTAEEKYITIA